MDDEERRLPLTVETNRKHLEDAVKGVFEDITTPETPEQVFQRISAEGQTEVTFSEVRSVLWKLIRFGFVDVTPDWKLKRHEQAPA